MSRHRALISSPIVSGLLCRFNYSDWSLRCAVVKQVRVYSSTYANADRNQDEGIGWITILLSHKNAAEHFIHTCNPTMHTNQPNGACKQTNKKTLQTHSNSFRSHISICARISSSENPGDLHRQSLIFVSYLLFIHSSKQDKDNCIPVATKVVFFFFSF